MRTTKKLKLLTADKPFLLTCLGLIIVLCFFYHTNKGEVVMQSSCEEQILTEINDFRVAKGMATLAWDERIAAVARQHSLKMAAGEIPFGHDNSQQRFAAISQSGINWIVAAENVACVGRFDDPASESFRWWLSNKSYQQNMEGNFNCTGIAVVQSKTKGNYYITQIYIKTLKSMSV
jgi:uncharacterized protein YkwD